MSGDWFDGSGNGASVDVAELLAGMTLQGITELVSGGALVSLGTTSDGGALSLTVTVDGRYRREYFRQQDELLSWIAEAIPAVEAAGLRPRASAVNGHAPRGRTKR